MVAATYSKVVIDPKMMVLLNWIDLCTEWEICESFKGINAHLEVSNKENSQAPGFRTEFGILYSIFYLCRVCFHDRPLTPLTLDFSSYSRWKTWSYDYIYIIKKRTCLSLESIKFSELMKCEMKRKNQKYIESKLRKIRLKRQNSKNF